MTNLNINLQSASSLVGPSNEELELYELRDRIRVIGGIEAKRIVEEMNEDLSVGRYDVGKYKRYLKDMENGKL